MPVVTPKLGLSYLALVKQTAQNTPVAPTTANSGKHFILLEQSFKPSQDVTVRRTGNQRDFSFAFKNAFVFGGSFQTYLYADEGAALLAWLMGTDTRTGASDPWTHTLSMTEPLPYLTCEVSWYQNSLIERVTDCKIAKIELDFVARKEVILTVHLLGCSVAVQSSPLTVAFNNGAGEGPARHADSVFTITGPTDGATIAGEIQSLKLTIDQGVMDQPGPGQVYPIALVEEGREISIKGKAMFTSDNLHRLTFYGTSAGAAVSSVVATGSMSVTATCQAPAVGPERSALFTVGQLFWTLSNPMFDMDGKTGMLDFEATGYRSGANLPLTAVFKNGVSTQYT